jgi:hypothetical protein
MKITNLTFYSKLMKSHNFGTATRIITRGFVRVLVFNATCNNISVFLIAHDAFLESLSSGMLKVE